MGSYNVNSPPYVGRVSSGAGKIPARIQTNQMKFYYYNSYKWQGDYLVNNADYKWVKANSGFDINSAVEIDGYFFGQTLHNGNWNYGIVSYDSYRSTLQYANYGNNIQTDDFEVLICVEKTSQLDARTNENDLDYSQQELRTLKDQNQKLQTNLNSYHSSLEQTKATVQLREEELRNCLSNLESASQSQNRNDIPDCPQPERTTSNSDLLLQTCNRELKTCREQYRYEVTSSPFTGVPFTTAPPSFLSRTSNGNDFECQNQQMQIDQLEREKTQLLSQYNNEKIKATELEEDKVNLGEEKMKLEGEKNRCLSQYENELNKTTTLEAEKAQLINEKSKVESEKKKIIGENTNLETEIITMTKSKNDLVKFYKTVEGVKQAIEDTPGEFNEDQMRQILDAVKAKLPAKFLDRK
jgi:hypothetical protein